MEKSYIKIFLNEVIKKSLFNTNPKLKECYKKCKPSGGFKSYTGEEAKEAALKFSKCRSLCDKKYNK